MTTQLTREDIRDQLGLVMLDAIDKAMHRHLCSKRFAATLVAAKDVGICETMLAERFERVKAQVNREVSKICKRLGIKISPQEIEARVAALRAKGPRS